jgi:hypothetical protein
MPDMGVWPMPGEAKDGALSRWGFWAIVCALAAIQAVLVSAAFPLSELFSGKPLFYIDNAYHWYTLKTIVGLVKDGVWDGYDPYFAGGVISGFSLDVSANAAKLLALLLHPWLSEGQVWKLYAFGSAVLAPVAVPFALRWLAADLRTLLIGSALGVALWWVSLFHWYYTAGMVSFVFVSFLTLPYFVALLRLLSAPYSIRATIGVGLAGTVMFFVHPLTVVPISLGVLCFIAINARQVALVRVVAVGTAVAVVAIVPNLAWLTSVLGQDIGPASAQPIYQSSVSGARIGLELLGIWGSGASGSKLYPLLAIAAVLPWLAGVPRQYRWQRTFLLFFVVLTLYAAFGGWSTAFAVHTQPNRYAPLAYLFLIPPAAFAIAGLSRQVAGPGKGRSAWFVRLSLGALSIWGLAIANEVRREVSPADIGHYGLRPPWVTGLGGYSHTVLDWLARLTTPDARVLFETSHARIHDGGHMAGYYAVTAGRELIGGPYPYVYFAGFWDGYLFGRPIELLTGAEFAEYARLYNIGWALVHSERSKAFFRGLPEATLLASYRSIALFSIARPQSYFLEGKGRVTERGFNRLVFDGVEPQGGSVVLAYQYIPGLKTDPEARVEPTMREGVPLPFIKIVHPPRGFTLSIP